ncbi:MAG: EF-hand domain-containing protein [Alphaproteobacteria bacterium]
MMKTLSTFKLTALGAALLLFSASPALAGQDGAEKGAPHHRGGAKMFEKHDLDGDGQVSKSEFMEMHENRFNEMDTDGDGKISSEEAKAFGEKKREEMQQRREEMKDKAAEHREEKGKSDHSGDE